MYCKWIPTFYIYNQRVSAPEALFDGSLPMDKALERAVVLEERKIAEAQIITMVQLTIDIVLAILRNIIVGERPLEFAAPSGLAMTISM